MILSIVVPVFNAEKYIGNCLKSLIDQNLPPDEHEIIVINDGSTDKSLAIIKEYQVKHSFIKIHNQENQGLSVTRNLALNLARGTYLYYIDADDYLIKNVMGSLLKVLVDQDLDILTFGSIKTTALDLYESTKVDVISHNPEVLSGEEYIIKKGFKSEVWWYICNKRFLLDTGIRFEKGRTMEDAFFTTALFLKARRMAHLPKDVHRYLQIPSSIMNASSPKHLVNTAGDLQFLVHQYDKLIDELSAQSSACEPRLRTKHDSFVFFLIIRLLRSNVPYSYLKNVIADLKKTRAYPMKHFMGLENSGYMYGLLTYAFNHNATLFLSFYGYRMLRKFRK